MEEKVPEVMKRNGEMMKSGEIAAILGVDSEEVSKAIEKLKAERKTDSPTRCCYQAK